MRVGGIILAGGRGRRMGVAKAELRFGNETLLQRMVRIVGEAVSPVVVVVAQDQEISALPAETIVARDRTPECGPLEGLAAGLKNLPDSDAVYVSGCDTPFLTPAFIRRVIELFGNTYEVAVPVVDKLPQPLAGVYRTSLLPQVEQLLADGRRRMLDLLECIPTKRILPEELRDVDPDLRSLRNLNTPADYQAALAEQGISPTK